MRRQVKIFFSSFVFSFVFFANCLLPTANCFAQITFEKYYDTINCYSGQCVQQTFDEGYIITGTHSVYAGNNNVVILKTDSVGNLKWLKSYGGTNNDGGTFIQQTPDSGFIAVGDKDAISSTNSKIWLLKTDKNGDTAWTKTITAGMGANVSECIQNTTDGGYIVCGYTSAKGAGSNDVFLVKTNSSGDTAWTKTFGGTDADVGTSLQQTTDGGYIITGYTFSSNPGEIDAYLIKTNSAGDTLWTKVFKGSNQARGFSVQQTTDGGYIIAGIQTISSTGNLVSYLVKTNSVGDTLWTKKYDTLVSNNAYSVQQTNDGGYIMGGSIAMPPNSYGNVYLIKTNNLGDTLWTKNFGGSGPDLGYFIRQTNDGGYIVTGESDSWAPYSIFLVKTDSAGFTTTGINQILSIKNNILVFPNPLVSTATVCIPEPLGSTEMHYEIFNLFGELIERNKIAPGQKQFMIEKKSPAGIYFLKVYSNSHEFISKIIIQ
ncbi:MAG: T9SS type A sorting domain-containing protein [Bacteroidetes bacterium]|nr:T9SS type A sorting domain-containing protein [Bacteroidota bacterium]